MLKRLGADSTQRDRAGRPSPGVRYRTDARKSAGLHRGRAESSDVLKGYLQVHERAGGGRVSASRDAAPTAPQHLIAFGRVRTNMTGGEKTRNQGTFE